MTCSTSSICQIAADQRIRAWVSPDTLFGFLVIIPLEQAKYHLQAFLLVVSNWDRAWR